MRTDIFLQQLAQRMDGDRKAISQAETILRSMIDRKLWKQMESSEELPKDIEQIETLLERHNIFFRPITLSDRWWTHCTGYMMGFMADDNTPIVLSPGFTDYTFIHPKTGKVMAASPKDGQSDGGKPEWRPAEVGSGDSLLPVSREEADRQDNHALCHGGPMYLRLALQPDGLRRGNTTDDVYPIRVQARLLGGHPLRRCQPDCAHCSATRQCQYRTGDGAGGARTGGDTYQGQGGVCAADRLDVALTASTCHLCQEVYAGRPLQPPAVAVACQFQPYGQLPIDNPDIPVRGHHVRAVLPLRRPSALYRYHRHSHTAVLHRTGILLYTESAAERQRPWLAPRGNTVRPVLRHTENQDLRSRVPCLPPVGKGVCTF